MSVNRFLLFHSTRLDAARFYQAARSLYNFLLGLSRYHRLLVAAQWPLSLSAAFRWLYSLIPDAWWPLLDVFRWPNAWWPLLNDLMAATQWPRWPCFSMAASRWPRFLMAASRWLLLDGLASRWALLDSRCLMLFDSLMLDDRFLMTRWPQFNELDNLVSRWPLLNDLSLTQMLLHLVFESLLGRWSRTTSRILLLWISSRVTYSDRFSDSSLESLLGLLFGPLLGFFSLPRWHAK